MNGRRVIGTIVASSILAVASFALDLPANKLVDAKWLKANMADKSLVVIDIREDGKLYKQAHIPGAIQWKVSDFREKRFGDIVGYVPAPLSFKRLMAKSGITKDSTVVFYSDGTANDSYTIAGLGVYVTEYYGFKNTAILNGGYAGWEKAGNAVDNKKVKTKKSDWKITDMDVASYASISQVDAGVEVNKFQLVDARGAAQVNGSKKHPKVKKAGHLPGAKHLFVGNFTKADGKVVYLDAASAKAQFAKANVDPKKPVIWYCNTSWYASGAWFAGKYLGGLENSKVYDGSMIEYTRAPKRKLIKSDI